MPHGAEGTPGAFAWDDAIEASIAGKASVAGRPINACDHGVTTALADMSVPLNVLIAANPGRTIVVPPGTYNIHADKGTPSTGVGGGIVIGVAGVTLDLRGVTITMTASSSDWYQMIDVSAADCTVIGGRLIGDVGGHTGTTGEFGYGISVGAGAHRFVADRTYASRMWGDGFFVWQRPSDVCLRSCIADDNRRQGLSIIDAIRPRVEGGAYINTGLTASTAPGAGIDLEPDASTTHDVIDALISDVMLSGNTGPGFLASGNGRTCTALVVGCKAVGNTLQGYSSWGSAVITHAGCETNGNTDSGFQVHDSAVTGASFTACTSRGDKFGFEDNGTRTTFSGCGAVDNLDSGIFLNGVGPTVSGFTAIGNCTVGTLDSNQISVLSPGATLTACISVAGSNATKPTYGFVTYATATGARLFGCDATGAFTAGPFIDLTSGAGTVAFPVPGATRHVAIATPTSDTVGTKAAIDAIRAALITAGITA